jgi:hypothetical protein
MAWQSDNRAGTEVKLRTARGEPEFNTEHLLALLSALWLGNPEWIFASRGVEFWRSARF